MATLREFYKKQKDYNGIKNTYVSQFKNVFISRYKINGLAYQENQFLLNELFIFGSVAIYKDKYTNIPIISKYTPVSYNQYRYPYRVQLINQTYTDTFTYQNNEDIAIIYAMYTRESVFSMIKKQIEKLVYIDLLLDNNTILQNIPFLLTVDDDNGPQGKDLLNRILNLDIAVIQKISSTSKVSLYNLNAPFLLDKLNDYKNNIIGEILTILGINNNQIEKRERMIVDEVNANNEYINTYYNIYADNIQSTLDIYNKLFDDNLYIDNKKNESEVINNEYNDNV